MSPIASDLTISVALCTRNGARFLPAQLASLAAQTCRPDELIVCDDASTDDTVACVEDFARRAPFTVRIERNPRALGVARNFERAFSLCSGALLFPCDQDDAWHPEKIAVLRQALAPPGNALLAFCDLTLVDEAGRSVGTTHFDALALAASERRALRAGHAFDVLLRRNVVTGCALGFSRRLCARALPVPDGWLHDEWLALVAAAHAKLACIERPLVQYRQHQTQAIGSKARGLFGQIRHAVAHMDLTYLESQLARARIAHTRLSELDPPIAPELLARLAERTQHWQRRVEMQATGRARLAGVLAEWRSGGYRRFGYGLKSAAWDVLLPHIPPRLRAG